MGMMKIKDVPRWLFDKMADLIVSIWDWKTRVWFQRGWSRPLKIKRTKDGKG